MAGHLRLPAANERDSMKDLAECPICFEVPRNGVMLQCKNGHNICATCKSQPVNKRCPQGRCFYANPPTVNRTVADLVARLFYEFPCKYSVARDVNHSSCRFKGTDDVLRSHEITCEHRSVPCPNSHCQVSVSVKKVIEHLETVHKFTAKAAASDMLIRTGFVWDENMSYSSEELPFRLKVGWAIPCVHIYNDLVHIWLQLVAHSSVTGNLRCKITLGEADNSMSFVTRVFPVGWTREMILGHHDCARINDWIIRKMLNEGTDGNERIVGLRAAFKIVEICA